MAINLIILGMFIFSFISSVIFWNDRMKKAEKAFKRRAVKKCDYDDLDD